MILVRTPLRITLGGGGTDLPFYYKKKDGFCVTAAIQKYTYVTLSETFYNYFILKYSKNEKVKKIKDIKHLMFKEIFNYFKVNKYIEATSLADIPSGTGMGSSASFIIGLCLALNKKFNKLTKFSEIIDLACKKEMLINNFTTGKQDQYAVAHPGINAFTFYKNDEVKRKEITLKNKTLKDFEKNFILVYSDISRSANKILNSQKKKFLANKHILKQYDTLKQLGYASYNALCNNDLDTVADILNTQADIKNRINRKNINSPIEEIRQACLSNGAKAGRVIGAGGGGFILFYTKNSHRFKYFLKKKGLKFLNIKIDRVGPKIII